MTYPVLLIIVSYVIRSESKTCKRVGSEIIKMPPHPDAIFGLTFTFQYVT